MNASELLVFGIWLSISGPANEPANSPHVSVHRALRDVINAGADLFNLQADYAGCYQLYRGSLLSLRPLVDERERKLIDDALQRAEQEPEFAERAYRLREAIDVLREQQRGPELIRAMPSRVP